MVVVMVVTVLPPVVTPVAPGELNSAEISAGPAHLILLVLRECMIALAVIDDTRDIHQVAPLAGIRIRI
jgi:hypothetical protein